MFLRRLSLSAKSRGENALRHNFVVGPLHESAIAGGPGHLYFCARCRWRFLVSRAGIVVLDDDGEVMSGPEADARFESFECGPCPALVAMNLERPAIAPKPASAERRRYSSPRSALLHLVRHSVQNSSPKA
jgi:hypothetical protein